MTVTAIVPQWNRSDLLRELLSNLRMQTRMFDEVIVVDNGSSDDSADVADSARAKVLRLGTNHGFAAAVNRGIAAAKADWVAILNNDVTLDPGWLEMLLREADRRNASFASGKILSATDPTMIDGTFDEISRGACAHRCGSGRADSAYWSVSRTIRMAPMTAAIFRRSLFDEIGMLDERFESYLEDVDFGLRCALEGRAGVYVPEAKAFHRGSATSGAWSSNTVRLIARNQMLLAAKYFRGQSRWPLVAGQLLWGVVALTHGKASDFFRGKWAGWRDAKFVTPFGGSADRVAAVVGESERQIVEVQEKTGFDKYWRIYFWMLGSD